MGGRAEIACGGIEDGIKMRAGDVESKHSARTSSEIVAGKSSVGRQAAGDGGAASSSAVFHVAWWRHRAGASGMAVISLWRRNVTAGRARATALATRDDCLAATRNTGAKAAAARYLHLR